MITHRHTGANNKHLKYYDPEKPTSYIIYHDTNNLYGWAMLQPLPVGDFECKTEFEGFDVNEVADNAEIGYILEVDLEYPEELHDLHNDYALAPEKIEITPEMLPSYCQWLAKDLEYKPSKVEKSVPNLWSKGGYILHYRNLQLYLSLGMKLTKIHRLLQFKQKAWLKPYIELNTKLRAKANNKFEKDFFKLMNNSVFGKTMEDVRKKRVNMKLVSEPSVFKKNVAKVTYKRSVVFVSNEKKKDYFLGMDMKRSTIILEKPIYTGFSVLDLSNFWMYNSRYNHMLRKHRAEKVKLLFTDTDSLMYYIQTSSRAFSFQ